ncbi:ABC transporter ATP-binding protein [Halorubrum ezzemoulense]|uniref:energy-coupling factor ABC transporter ATP-binding protein n=1 Tax=Halorubrum ezzemoulense TaxID=337243 RepID=UPI00232EB109|nr:ABC transporter ATP-binding protein [Halorubrum ezzemoulense]MDB9301670.1 ABC transporter ATP-binding protein [Halorubrum ezzemoulense]
MIAVNDLTHAFDGAVALDSVSLSIDDGEFLLVTGPNGSGKTTLVRHFNGLLSPTEGEVRVNGVPAEADLVAARTAVGMVFQRPADSFVAATIAADVAFGPENLGLSHDEIDRRVATALDAVNLAGRGDERIDALSGGEKARVAVAGALAMEPDHLVLDEPFSGLDEPARRSLLSHLASLSADGTGIVVVTHDLRGLIDRCDRVIALADGSIALDAPPEAARAELPALDVHVPASERLEGESDTR